MTYSLHVTTRVLAPHEDSVSAIASDQDISILTLMHLPTPLCIHTLNYLGETQEELETLTVLSKKFNEDYKQAAIEWNIIPTIELNPLKHDGGHTVNYFAV